MPFTPFHFGIGLLAKGSAPRRVSLSAFVASQVVIDCETAFFLMQSDWPVHRWFHTFLVGIPIGILSGLVTYAVGRHVRLAWRNWHGTLAPSEVALRACLLGGALGGMTHPILDGIMHWDIRPFYPFTAANPLEHLVSLTALHLLCIGAGIAGALLLAVRRSMIEIVREEGRA